MSPESTSSEGAVVGVRLSGACHAGIHSRKLLRHSNELLVSAHVQASGLLSEATAALILAPRWASIITLLLKPSRLTTGLCHSRRILYHMGHHTRHSLPSPIDQSPSPTGHNHPCHPSCPCLFLPTYPTPKLLCHPSGCRVVGFRQSHSWPAAGPGLIFAMPEGPSRGYLGLRRGDQIDQ